MSKAEKTRQFIIEKTAPLFNTRGFAGTSLNDMTAATGLTKGSIYGNFANKDEVALEAFECNLNKVENMIRDEMGKERSCRDKLLVYARVYDNFLKSPFPEGGCPILNTATEADDTHPGLRARASTAVTSWKKSIEKLVRKGMEQKEFRRETNPEQVALTMIAMIEGAIMITKLTGKNNYKNSVMLSVEDLVKNL